MRQAHRQHGVAGLEQRGVRRQVGAGAGVRLQVRVLRAEQLLRPGDADLLGPVDDLATAVVALAGVALGVLVRQRRAQRREDGGRGEVLARDQLQAAAKPVQLVGHDRRDVRVGGGQGVEIGSPEGRGITHRQDLRCAGPERAAVRSLYDATAPVRVNAVRRHMRRSCTFQPFRRPQTVEMCKFGETRPRCWAVHRLRTVDSRSRRRRSRCRLAAMRDIPADLLARPFTSKLARAVGVTPRQLQGARCRRLFQDVYVGAHVPITPELLAAAVSLVLPAGAVVGGTMAALLHGADVRRRGDIGVGVIVSREAHIRRRGIRVKAALLEPGDIVVIGGIPVTSAVRTAFDLARTPNLIESVVGVDAMLNRGGCTLDELVAYVASHRGWRGVRWADAALFHAEPKAESPMETRQRMQLVLAGLPRPTAQLELVCAGNVARPARAVRRAARPQLRGMARCARVGRRAARRFVARGQRATRTDPGARLVAPALHGDIDQVGLGHHDRRGPRRPAHSAGARSR